MGALTTTLTETSRVDRRRGVEAVTFWGPYELEAEALAEPEATGEGGGSVS
jgi:hypothetical protein